jgi:drug/metabolite transporter (DMT)-like permease
VLDICPSSYLNQTHYIGLDISLDLSPAIADKQLLCRQWSVDVPPASLNPTLAVDVLALVLLGALLHATWNALVKSGTDKMLDASMVALGASVTALITIPFLPMPERGAWPFVMGSMVIHFVYYQLVAAAYRAGDIGLTYPLMRGTAPLLVAATSGMVLGEGLSVTTEAGVLAISCGVLTMAVDARAGGGLRAVVLALLNALVIAFYTYVDGYGARASGNAIAYTLWISVLPPIPLFLYAVYARGRAAVATHVRTHLWRGLAGGFFSIASYGLALWAMTRAPVATIAALRETSIVFATLISVLVLKERVSPARIMAAGTITLGALVLKLG